MSKFHFQLNQDIERKKKSQIQKIQGKTAETDLSPMEHSGIGSRGTLQREQVSREAEKQQKDLLKMHFLEVKSLWERKSGEASILNRDELKQTKIRLNLHTG